MTQAQLLESFGVPALWLPAGEGHIAVNSLCRELLAIYSLEYADVLGGRAVASLPNGGSLQETAMEAIRTNTPVARQFGVVNKASGSIDTMILYIVPDCNGGAYVCWTKPNGGAEAAADTHAALGAADSGTFYDAILDSSTETFIIAVSPDGRILSFNEGARLMFGYRSNEVSGRMHVATLFSDDEREADVWETLVSDAMKTGKSERLTTLRRKDWSVFPALVDLTPLRNAEQHYGTLFLGRDMTETLKTQHALEERNQELEFINTLSRQISRTLNLEEVGLVALENLNRAFDGIVGALYSIDNEDISCKLITTMPAPLDQETEDYLQPSFEEYHQLYDGAILFRAVGDDVPELITKDDAPVTRLVIPLQPKTTVIGAVTLISRQKLEPTVEQRRFIQAAGATIGAAVENAVLYDDSVSKSHEIRKQNQELDEFTYVVSHDLKEPLAGISFISKLLQDDYYENLDETGKTYISSLQDYARRLGSLIDTLLDLSRIGRVAPPAERVDLKEVIFNIQQNLFHKLGGEAGAELHVVPDLPEVFGDKTRIEQVFFNLISNAIKFNDKPKPLVEVGYNEIDEDFYAFSVKDNGIGIETQYFDKIFKIFERLHQREEYAGNGAGLTIVKKIIEHHGGRIWLHSDVNVGTAFFFTLPKFKIIL